MSADNNGSNNSSAFDLAKQKSFLQAYASIGTVTHAAKAAGCSRTSHAKWMKRDPTYPPRFRQAKLEAADALEAEARRRAIEGIRRVVVQKGSAVFVWVNAAGEIVPDNDPAAVRRQALVEHIFSDRLLEVLLRGHLPHRYRERKEVMHKGDVSVKIESKEAKLARIRDAIAQLRAKGNKADIQLGSDKWNASEN